MQLHHGSVTKCLQILRFGFVVLVVWFGWLVGWLWLEFIHKIQANGFKWYRQEKVDVSQEFFLEIVSSSRFVMYNGIGL